MPESKLISAEYRPHLQRILKSRILQKKAMPKKMLAYCAEETIEGRHNDLTQQSIAAYLWPKKEDFDPASDAGVRNLKSALKDDLVEYYRYEGKGECVGLDMPEGHYYVTVEDRRVWPFPKAAAWHPPNQISLSAFKNFLITMCEPEDVTTEERNRLLEDWKAGTSCAKVELKEGKQFDDFFCQSGRASARRSLTFAEMRSLTKCLGIHPLMLDPLLSEPVATDYLGLALGDFIAPEKPEDESHGHRAQYAVPAKRLKGSDASLVYLALEPTGRSDIHHHPGDEFLLVLDGDVEVRLQDSGLRAKLRQGEAIHFHAEQTHSAINLSENNPAHLFIIRFYQMETTPNSRRLPTRQQMRRDLRHYFGHNCGQLAAPVRAWVLQALTHRSGPRGGQEKEPDFIQDRLGLARMVRLLPKPRSGPERTFLNRVGGLVNCEYREWGAFLKDIETGELKFPKVALEYLCDLHERRVYDMLFLRFLFPGAPTAMVFHPAEEEDAVDVKVLANLPPGASYLLPRRNLECSETAIVQLTLQPRSGSLWNRHPGSELLVPLEGTAQIEFRDPCVSRRVSADQCQLAHYRSDKEHRVWNPGESEARLMVLRFYGEGQPLSTRGKRR